MDDLSRWRADTPGADRRVHLNNAGASLVTAGVQDAIRGHLSRESELGGYEAADAARAAISQAYEAVGRIVGAPASQIAMSQSSTTAFAQALAAFDFSPGDAILTTRADYASNQIMYMSLAARRGVDIIRADDLAEGGVDPDSVGAILRRRRPALVAVTWVPTNSGLVQDVAAIGALTADAGVPYLVDACQAVGQIPIDVSRLQCDFLAATARKFLRGPRGIGFLYVSPESIRRDRFPLLVDMRGATWTGADAFELKPDARRFETWEISHALVLGLGAAAEYALHVGVERAGGRARALAERARESIGAIPGARVLDRGRDRCAIATFAFRGKDGAALKLALRAAGINTSSPGREDAVIDMDAKGVESALRVSPHYYNTESEIDRAAEMIGTLTRG